MTNFLLAATYTMLTTALYAGEIPLSTDFDPWHRGSDHFFHSQVES